MATAIYRAGARAEPSQDEREYARLLARPPLQLDCPELQAILERLEAAGAPRGLLSKGITKLEYAERVQLSARMQRLAVEMEELITAPPLDLDRERLGAAMQLAEELPSFNAEVGASIG